MNDTEQRVDEKSDSWWYRIYIAVIINTIFVITALWAFSKAFE